MKNPLKRFFSGKEAVVIQWEGANLVLHPVPGVRDALPASVMLRSSESLSPDKTWQKMNLGPQPIL